MWETKKGCIFEYRKEIITLKTYKMTTLINTLNNKKQNLETILNSIHTKRNSNIDNYTSKELSRCALIIKQIKSIDLKLNNYQSNLLTVA